MRIFLSLLLLHVAAFVHSQPNGIAKPVALVNTATDQLFAALVKEGQQHFVELSGSGWGMVTIAESDEAVLRFADDSIRLRSVGLQSFDYGAARPSYTHRYTIAANDVPQLARGRLVAIRKSSFGEWSSITIPAKGAEAWKAFTAALNPPPTPVAKPIATTTKATTTTYYIINLTQLSRHGGDSVVFCARVLSADIIGRTVLLQLQDGTGAAQVIIPADYKAAFPAPVGLYTGKEICVAGLVQVVNNTPQLVLRSRQGLKVLSPLTDADAAYFVGDSVTLTGTVASAAYLASSATKPTLLNTGAAYPDQALTVMIAQSDRAAFGGQPEKDFLSRRIAVSGVVTLHKGKPQIVVRQKEQLRLLDAKPATNATVAKPLASTLPNPAPQPTTAATIPTSIDIEPAARREKVVANNEVAETLATYPGGDAAQQAFLRGQLQCPASAGDETKTVTASFQVESDGSITGIRIEKSGSKTYDAEVVRALQQMPKWKPRVRNGFTTLDKLYQTFTFYCARRRGA